MYPDALLDTFRQRFGAPPTLIVRAPGRINLIGEHTDYNEGFVMPAAIGHAIWFAVSPRPDERLEFFAQDLNERFSGRTSRLEKSDKDWPDYLLGVYSELQQDGYQPGGINLIFGGDIPLGAGLSSSAAVESGLLLALSTLFDYQISRLDLARLARRAENNFVGVRCGIMDMYASLHGRAGQAMLLDCRSLETEYIPVDFPDHQLVLCDSGVKHSLATSEYNTRREECEAGVAQLAKSFPEVKSLRDATPAMLEAEKEHLPEVVFRRCRYVVEENARVLAAAQALREHRLADFGKLLHAAHEGARHDFEISCAEIDFLIEKARANEAVVGARMMGGGFGGCTLNVVRRDAVADFEQEMQAAYQAAWNRELRCYEVEIVDGAEAREA